MRPLFTLALGLALAACGGAGENESETETETEKPRSWDTSNPQPEMRAVPDSDLQEMGGTSVEGVVQVVGSDPSPQVVLRGGSDAAATQVALVGELREELGRLSGVVVSVIGTRVDNPQAIPEEAIDVADYDVISVNSEPAYLGSLEVRDGEWWLEGESSFRLTNLPEQLEGLAGSKVWITGPVDGGELRVQSFGVVSRR